MFLIVHIVVRVLNVKVSIQDFIKLKLFYVLSVEISGRRQEIIQNILKLPTCQRDEQKTTNT